MAKNVSDDTEDDEPRPKKSGMQGDVRIYEPMFVWIFLLSVAVVLNIILADTPFIPQGSVTYTISDAYIRFMLQLPGMVILPLIMGAMIGSDVGKKATSAKSATKAGLLNGIYASLVYFIAMIVIYMVISYLTMQYVSKTALVTQDIVFPVLVFLATLESFALLSFLKKVS